MGKIKERIYDLVEMVQEILDSGVSDAELDEYMEAQLKDEPGMIEFYHVHKDIIFDMLGYMKESIIMPRMNEDSFDEQEWFEDEDNDEDEEDYNDDDLADYEWSVGAIITAQLEDQGISIDSDNLGDALYDKMDFIHQCMKDNWNSLDCAVELINDEKFMSYITDEENEYDDEIDESINENSQKYDINAITNVAFNSLDKWIDYHTLKHHVEELKKIKKDNIDFDKIIDMYFSFWESHIHKFFDIFLKNHFVEQEFLEDNREEIVYRLVQRFFPNVPLEEIKDIHKEVNLYKKPVTTKAKSYSEMSQYDLKKEVDAALDRKDYDTLRKIQPYLKESFLKKHVVDLLNEATIDDEIEITPLLERCGCKKIKPGLAKRPVPKPVLPKTSPKK